MTRPAFLFDLEGTLIDSVLARSADLLGRLYEVGVRALSPALSARVPTSQSSRGDGRRNGPA
jgi:hypothetical protein